MTSNCYIWVGKKLFICLTSRFHVAVHLFSNRSLMTPCVSLMFYYILTSFVIYYPTDACRHGIYWFYMLNRKGKSINLPHIYWLFEDFLPVWAFSMSQTATFHCCSLFFSFILFVDSFSQTFLMHANEVETKEKQKLPEIKS